MDDGSLVSNTRRGVFCTDSCSLKEVKIIQKYLQKVWGIITHISKTVRSKKDGRTVVYLRLNIRSSEYLMKFLRIVLPYVSVKAMLYKFLLIYKDSEIQQRWISEVSSLSGFDKNSIQEIVNYRKSKLKVFQRKI